MSGNKNMRELSTDEMDKVSGGTSGEITAGDVDLLSGSTLSINGKISSEENVKIIAKNDIQIGFDQISGMYFRQTGMQ